jgi:signal transduction histidine kinase
MEERTRQLQLLNKNLEKEIFERKKAETTFAKLNRELKAISNCNQTLVRAVDEQTLLNEICRIVCEEAGYKLAWVGYAEHDAAKTVRPVAWYGYDDGYAAHANITWDENSERGQGSTGQAIRSGCSVYSQNLLHDPKYKPWVNEAIKRGFQGSIALPMKNDTDEVFGAFMLYSSEPDIITNEELRMLEELAGDLAFGITSLRIRNERVKAQQDLMKAKENAELSDRLKTVFLQNISHEIRTPMNAISGFTQLMNSPNLTPSELSEYTDIVQKNVDQLLTIITDILTISSIETSQVLVNQQLTNINDILDEKPYLFKNQLHTRNCDMMIDKSLVDAQAFIYTDGTKLSDVLNHLISNAMKFTENGTIKVGYEKKGQELEFYVKDTGIGIDRTMSEIIFDPFRKVNNEPLFNSSGTGLGLSISKGYVKLLGGRIRVDSEVGKGSVFYFTIPYIPAL